MRAMVIIIIIAISDSAHRFMSFKIDFSQTFRNWFFSGDAGAPLVFFDHSVKTEVQIGIVSWGGKCAEPHAPRVYARISAVRDWIFDNTGI